MSADFHIRSKRKRANRNIRVHTSNYRKGCLVRPCPKIERQPTYGGSTYRTRASDDLLNESYCFSFSFLLDIDCGFSLLAEAAPIRSSVLYSLINTSLSTSPRLHCQFSLPNFHTMLSSKCILSQIQVFSKQLPDFQAPSDVSPPVGLQSRFRYSISNVVFSTSEPTASEYFGGGAIAVTGGGSIASASSARGR